MGMYLITLTPFLLFLTGGFQVNQNAIFFRQFLTGKNLHIINLGMKECF